MKNLSILRKCEDMQRPIQRVKFTKDIAHHTRIRDQKIFRSDMFAQVNLISVARGSVSGFDRTARASIVEADRRCIQNLKEKNKATFFSPSENTACIKF